MILGFAHLAINCGDLAQAEAEWRALGYARGALHQGVPNHPAKRAFSSHYQPEHDLLLLNGPGLWPLELTCHGPTQGENRQLAWTREAITLTLADPEPMRRLLIDGLGFRASDNGVLALDCRLPTWSCRLHPRTGESEPVRLDAAGPTCLAFYCNRVEEDAQRLLGLGASDYSGVFDLTLGERAMSIAMLRAPGGPLLELISPRTQTP
ncbi:MAG: hypothetical protein Q8O33_07020 [Pseudomonadota bacterium]|nr:hypothetical protein [Pseudomonadota bacterium]